MSQQRIASQSSFPLYRSSSQGGGSSNSHQNQIISSQQSAHLQQPMPVASMYRAPSNPAFASSFSKLHSSFSQGGGRPSAAERQLFGSQRPSSFNLPSSRLHETNGVLPSKQEASVPRLPQPPSSQHHGENMLHVDAISSVLFSPLTWRESPVFK